ncbi:MAG TPA: aldehyde dehydrogenase (NADP(+)) [Opitutaceae bacterium]|jgi:NADP-dependent aldehyde dehydrogenase|nr:aldehyde dehydrogenase (NADP(+)) [Opitutaceae bacterium]
MPLHGQSLIAGQPGSASGRTFSATSPATGESLAPPFHVAPAEAADAALRAAAAAFPAFRRAPAEKRAWLLDAIAAEIEALGDGLITRAQAETGLPAARLKGERDRTCGQLRLFAGVVREGSWIDARIDPALPARAPLPRPDLRRMLVPIGPVVVFGASNFPLAFSVAGGDTASALAAGCPVIVKAHEAHPGTSEMVAAAVYRALAATELPAGLFSLLHGEGAGIGIALVRHPLAAAVGFTGSHAAGRALCDAAAARREPIPVFAEMSSLNPFFALPGALREQGPAIAQGLAGSITLGVGQFCTKPGLVFAVRGAETDRFVAALAEAAGAIPAGTMLTPAIRGRFVAAEAQLTSQSGVERVQGGGAADAAKSEARVSIARTSAAHFLQHPELATEAFGPFALLIVGESLAELERCAGALEGQLTATVHASSGDEAAAGALFAVLQAKAGRLIVNGYPTGVEVCPAMQHGGPYPATSDPRFTSVGTAAILRFARPVCYQGFPAAWLPPELRDENPLGLLRLVNGERTRNPLPRSPDIA